jgi:hypothetical protein
LFEAVVLVGIAIGVEFVEREAEVQAVGEPGWSEAELVEVGWVSDVAI